MNEILQDILRQDRWKKYYWVADKLYVGDKLQDIMVVRKRLNSHFPATLSETVLNSFPVKETIMEISSMGSGRKGEITEAQGLEYIRQYYEENDLWVTVRGQAMTLLSEKETYWGEGIYSRCKPDSNSVKRLRLSLRDFANKYNCTVLSDSVFRDMLSVFHATEAEKEVNRITSSLFASDKSKLDYTQFPSMMRRLICPVGESSFELTMNILNHFLWQIKMKALDKPVANPLMIICSGVQGTGKTTLALVLSKALGTAYSKLSFNSLFDTKAAESYSKLLLVNLDESAKLKADDMQELKSLITGSDRTGRPNYESHLATFSTRASLISSTNSETREMYVDTEMRRFASILMNKPKNESEMQEFYDLTPSEVCGWFQTVDIAIPSVFTVDVSANVALKQHQNSDLSTQSVIKDFWVEDRMYIKRSDVLEELTPVQVLINSAYNAFKSYCGAGGYAYYPNRKTFINYTRNILGVEVTDKCRQFLYYKKRVEGVVDADVLL